MDVVSWGKGRIDLFTRAGKNNMAHTVWDSYK